MRLKRTIPAPSSKCRWRDASPAHQRGRDGASRALSAPGLLINMSPQESSLPLVLWLDGIGKQTGQAGRGSPARLRIVRKGSNYTELSSAVTYPKDCVRGESGWGRNVRPLAGPLWNWPLFAVNWT